MFYALDEGVGVDCPGIDSYIEQDIGAGKKLKAAKAFQWFAKFLQKVIEPWYLARNDLANERRNFREDLGLKVESRSEFQKIGNKVASAETQEKNTKRKKDPKEWLFKSDKMRKITKHILKHCFITEIMEDFVTMSEEEIVRKYTEYKTWRLFLLILLGTCP